MQFMKQIFIFLAFVLIVGFLTFHDKKKDYAEIGKTNFTSYVERVDGCKKVGICDKIEGYIRMIGGRYALINT